MKKIISLFLIATATQTFGYTTQDIENANFLANQGIIQYQSHATNYRLDATITRAEAIGIALKIKGTILPNSYVCKGYFSDTVTNDWKCRAIEVAADNGIISRNNTRARPNDMITKSEMLAILLKDVPFNIEDYPHYGAVRAPLFDSGNEWQYDIMTKALALEIIHPPLKKIQVDCSQGCMSDFIGRFQFFPNRNAIRAEVFTFAKNLLNSIEIGCGSCLPEISLKHVYIEDESMELGKVWRYWPMVSRPLSGDDYGCTLSFADRRNYDQLLRSLSIQSYPLDPIITNGFVGLRLITEMNGPTETLFILDNNGKIITLNYEVAMRHNCLNEIIPLNQTFNNIDVLQLYYNNLNTWDKETAYSMRSPTGISLSTFQSWYKNVTNVNFREDTLKNLGDNTYEFLVNITENGVISTYTVKSKVDLANFTINNISSIKQ